MASRGARLPVGVRPLRDVAALSTADCRARHLAKIRQIGDALFSGGVVTLDAQAEALGVPRSTAWTILKAEHKNRGLSAKVITRILRSPQLPPPVRTAIIEYAEEKAAGRYGRTTAHTRRFLLALSSNGAARRDAA